MHFVFLGGGGRVTLHLAAVAFAANLDWLGVQLCPGVDYAQSGADAISEPAVRRYLVLLRAYLRPRSPFCQA